MLRLNAYRGLTDEARRAGPEGSLGKWHWAEVNQSLTELAMDVAGSRAVSRRPVAVPLPARPRELDRGRHDRDPQEHRRRARAGAAARMNFDLSEDQRTIKSTAREFLAARYPLAEVRRLALEEERGFTDRSGRRSSRSAGRRSPSSGTVEMVVVAEELGYALAPTPLQSTWAAGLFGAPLGRAAARWSIDGLAADAGYRRRAGRLGRRRA